VRSQAQSRAPVGVFVGLCTLDVVHEVERAPAVNEKVTARAQSVAAGGPATNAAVTFAALGGRATLLTVLGTGPLADVVRADLTGCGVGLHDVAGDDRDVVPVSSVFVLADSGERAVVSVDAGLMTVGEVPDPSRLISTADVVLADGHHPALAEAAAGAAAGCAVPLLVDAGRWRPAMPRLLAGADTVICSAQFRVPGSDDEETTARGVLDRGTATVAVTSGGGPVRWWAGDRSGRVKPPPVDVVDTAGAGDALHGAYAFAMAAAPSASVDERLGFAVQVASLKCAFRGTRSWLAELAGRVDGLTATLAVGLSRPNAAARSRAPHSRPR
jgi:sugar/nucleoside kinase (ribokinase family)